MIAVDLTRPMPGWPVLVQAVVIAMTVILTTLVARVAWLGVREWAMRRGDRQ